MSDDGDLLVLHLPSQRVQRSGQLRRAAHQAVAVVVIKTGGLLAVERHDFGQCAEISGRAAAAVHQHGYGLLRIEMQGTVWIVGARPKSGNGQTEVVRGRQSGLIICKQGRIVRNGGAPRQDE